ncbi:MAG: hypothetical protein AAGF01_00585 [Cyanobacteria bacterium P01_G01_bin.38]
MDIKPQKSDKEPSKIQVQLAVIGLIGTLAGTVGVALIANWDKIVPNQSVATSSNPSEISSLEDKISMLEAEVQEKDQTIKEQESRIRELESRLLEMNEDIAMNPAAAMSFLPYALRRIGATDGTIDCATPSSDALKDLACQQIQTLLNSVNSSYELTQQRANVRSQVARYQSEHGLNMGQDSRKAGMLDEQTLKFLIQDRLSDVGSERTAEDYFP